MRNIFLTLFLVFCVGCGDDVIMGGTETEGLLGFCGDRIVNGDEECDEFSDDCSGCVLARRAFVTSMTLNGLYPPVFEGKCYSIAEEAGLYRGLGWSPWMSLSFYNANEAFFQSPFKYERVDGALIANNYADLIDGNIENPINIDQNGDILNDRVWTGTNADGTFSTANCLDWNDQNQALGTFGWTNATNEQWSNGGVVRCSEMIHIYCIEDDNIGINKW